MGVVRQFLGLMTGSSLLLSGGLLLSSCAVPGPEAGLAGLNMADPSGVVPVIDATDPRHRDRVSLLGEELQPQRTVSGKRLSKAMQDIEALLQADYQAAGIKPNARASDEVFLRRAYLDIVGRIPTASEITAFGKLRGTSKRQKLVAELIGSPGYQSHQFNKWADILRLKSRMRNRNDGGPYIDYLKTAIGENRPYDRMVTELLTAEGSIWEKGNGATGYYVRDAGMPEDNIANTMQIFLGTSIACAQCHDHPFDKWTRHEFMSLSAYTASTKAGRYGNANLRSLQREAKKRNLSDTELRRLRQIARSLFQGVSPGNKKAVKKLPKDWQYENGKPGDLVHAKALFGPEAPVSPGQDPRQVFADWVTSTENPRFTRVIVNRLWKQAMGVGLFEPVDDLKEDTPITNEALLIYLEQLMVELDYDVQAFQTILYSSEVYGRAASKAERDPDTAWHFPGPVLRRMTAEQIWDSVVTLVIPDADGRVIKQSNIFYANYERLKDADLDDFLQAMREQDQARKMTQQMRAEGRAIQQRMRAAKTREERRAIQQEAKALRAKREAVANGESSMMGEMQRKTAKDMAEDPKYKGYDKRLVRASELPSPAPNGHFLRQFGQSDREIIENASDAATVPQALALMNGYADRELLNAKSVLVQEMRAAKSPEAAVEAVFQSILTRKPTHREKSIAMQVVRNDREKGVADLVWALLNTHEFLFVQ